MQQNQSHQVDEGARGEHFRPKISHKKLITYPLNPKISWGELGTSAPFVPVKERPLILTLGMSPCTNVIHRGCTPPALLSLVLFSPKGRDFCRKILLWERTFDNLKKFPGGLPGGFWPLELTDALIGNEIVSCLYSFQGYDGYDVNFFNCVEEGSKQCED